MASQFDRLMQRADDKLFKVFGERSSCAGPDPIYIDVGGLAPPVNVDVNLDRNVQVAGADGIFRAVQVLAEIRLCQVPKPRRGSRLVLPDAEWLLEEPVDSDGIVERWSLLPSR